MTNFTQLIFTSYSSTRRKRRNESRYLTDDGGQGEVLPSVRRRSGLRPVGGGSGGDRSVAGVESRGSGRGANGAGATATAIQVRRRSEGERAELERRYRRGMEVREGSTWMSMSMSSWRKRHECQRERERERLLPYLLLSSCALRFLITRTL